MALSKWAATAAATTADAAVPALRVIMPEEDAYVSPMAVNR
jgi:hypothetical protein